MRKFFFMLLLSILFWNSAVYSFQYTLTACAIFNDEAPYLKEWIDYHKKVGVEHFWLYNNNSIDNYVEVLMPYIQEGTVTLIEWPSEIKEPEKQFQYFCYTVQVGAYNDALNKARGVSKWLALIDTDEFIVPSFEKDVPTVLEKNFSFVSGLCVNWQLFGTSNVPKVESGQSMLKQLIWKMRWDKKNNNAYKSIVQPLHVKKCVCPHRCEYLSKHWHVNTNLERIDINANSVHIEHLRLHHYWARDEFFFYNVKLPRQIQWKRDPQELLNNLEIMHDEKDYTILRFLD